MKKLVLVLIALLFVTGCVGNTLIRKIYDEKGNLQSVLEIKNLNGFVNTETGVFAFGIEDGEFKVWVILLDRRLEDSPESATSIFDGLTNLLTVGTSGTLNGIIK